MRVPARLCGPMYSASCGMAMARWQRPKPSGRSSRPAALVAASRLGAIVFAQHIAADDAEVADALRDQAGNVVVAHQQKIDRPGLRRSRTACRGSAGTAARNAPADPAQASARRPDFCMAMRRRSRGLAAIIGCPYRRLRRAAAVVSAGAQARRVMGYRRLIAAIALAQEARDAADRGHAHRRALVDLPVGHALQQVTAPRASDRPAPRVLPACTDRAGTRACQPPCPAPARRGKGCLRQTAGVVFGSRKRCFMM